MDTTLSGTVLILENEPIIAIELEGALTDAGFDVLSVLPTSHEALQWLQVNEPDMVVLDIHLNDGSCHEVADLLVAHGTPFIVFSASTPTAGVIADVFLQARWVAKPAPSEEVIAALHSLQSQAA